MKHTTYFDAATRLLNDNIIFLLADKGNGALSRYTITIDHSKFDIDFLCVHNIENHDYDEVDMYELKDNGDSFPYSVEGHVNDIDFDEKFSDEWNKAISETIGCQYPIMDENECNDNKLIFTISIALYIQLMLNASKNIYFADMDESGNKTTDLFMW